MASLARAFAIFTGASIVSMAVQIAKGKLSAIYLGPEGVGVLNQLTNAWSFCSIVAGLGFYNGMVRHLSQYHSAEAEGAFDRQATSSLLFLLGVSWLLTAIGCCFGGVISNAIFADGGARQGLIDLSLLSLPVYVASQVYRAMLNATRNVRGQANARIIADVLSAVVSVILIVPFGLIGAVYGFMGLQILFLATSIYYVAKEFGFRRTFPRITSFSWDEVWRNAGFGLNGLLSSAVGIFTAIVVSKWVIADIGLPANGLFSVALKVATIYLGGFSAVAVGHYLPSLAGAKSNSEMYRQINDAVHLYQFVIPPVAAFLIIGGGILLKVFFSEKFVPAETLILCMVPGDLFRISAETVSLAFVARRKLFVATTLYITWAAIYLTLSFVLLRKYGLVGAAAAYLVSQISNMILVAFAARRELGYGLPANVLWAAGRGVVLVGLAAVATPLVRNDLARCAIGGIMIGGWLGLSLTDQLFLGLTRRAMQLSPFRALRRRMAA